MNCNAGRLIEECRDKGVSLDESRGHIKATLRKKG